jgi:hypothetical protein
MNVAQFGSGLLLIVLSAGLYFASRSRKSHAGQLNQAQTLDLQQAAQGRFYGKFQGSIVADQALTTPYSARAAVAWSARLERGREESSQDGTGTTTRWDTVWSQSATTPFRLKGAGELWFDQRGGMPNLDAPSTFDQYIHDTANPIIAPYATNRGLLGRLNRPNFHAVETSFAPGSQAFFVGPVEAVNGFWVTRPGQGKEYSVLTWKSEQQVRSRMSRAGTIWWLLSLLAFAAGILAIIVSFN